MATLTWTPGDSGNWSLATDWLMSSGASAATPPGAADTALITSGTVIASNKLVVGALVMQGGTATPTLTLTGDMTVTGGAGFAGTADLTGQGITTLQGGSGAGGTLVVGGGRSVANAGTFILTGQIVVGDASGTGQFNTLAGGELDIDGSGTVVATGADGGGISNAGALNVSVPGVATVAAVLANSGALSVNSGTLALADGGGSSGSGITVASGAELDISGGDFVLSGGSYDVVGLTRIDGGVFDVSAALIDNPVGEIEIDAGVLLAAGREVTINSLVVDAPDGGMIESTSAVQAATLDIAGVVAAVGPGSLMLLGSGTIGMGGTAAPGDGLYLDDGQRLYNYGSLVLAAGSIVLGDDPIGAALGGTLGGARLINAAGGVLNFAGDGLAIEAGIGAISFANYGTIEKTAGTGVDTIGVSLSNSGVLDIASGTLDLTGGGRSFCADAVVAAGAALEIGGGDFVIASHTWAPAGSVLVSGGTLDVTRTSAVVVNEQVAVSGGLLWLGGRRAWIGNFDQTGGELTGTSVVTISGTAAFGGIAVQSGFGTTVVDNATLDATGTTGLEGLYLDGGRDLQNDGTFVLAQGSILLGGTPSGVSSGSGLITNNGTFEIQTDGTVVAAGAGYAAVANNGTLVVSAGTGTAVIGTGLTNTGIVEVASGTLAVAGGVQATGSYLIEAGTGLDFASAVLPGAAIDFVGTGGVLVLGEPGQFYGTVAGFGGGNSLDLLGLSWVAGASAAYADAGGSGTLTVTSGAVSVGVTLEGSYGSYGFAVHADGNGGVMVS